MSMIERLDQALRAVCPIQGISVGRVNDKKTWRIDFTEAATDEERAAALALIEGFDLTAERRRVAVARLNAAFEEAAEKLIAGYPPSERLTWSIQEAEALARQRNAAAPTPYLDALAAGRGVTTAHLVQRVAANSAAWRATSAQLVAQRHKGEDAIAAAEAEAEINAARDAALAALQG